MFSEKCLFFKVQKIDCVADNWESITSRQTGKLQRNGRRTHVEYTARTGRNALVQSRNKKQYVRHFEWWCFKHIHQSSWTLTHIRLYGLALSRRRENNGVPLWAFKRQPLETRHHTYRSCTLNGILLHVFSHIGILYDSLPLQYTWFLHCYLWHSLPLSPPNFRKIQNSRNFCDIRSINSEKKKHCVCTVTFASTIDIV